MGIKRKRISKDTIIRAAAEVGDETIGTTRNCYYAIEQVIKDCIASTKQDKPLSIRLCDGFNIDCDYVPAKQKRNNLTGEMINVAGRIKPKFNITRTFIKNLNSQD